MVFYIIGNFVSITSKTLREDHTAADKMSEMKYLPQMDHERNKRMIYER